MSDLELDLLSHYRELHDRLSEMIESGRLKEAAIPDDYRWLVEALVEAAEMGAKVDAELAEENGEAV